MESGTYIFKDWLESLGRIVASREIPVALDVISSQAEQAFGIRIWFAQILCRRWSYIAGLRSERPTRSDTVKFPLAAGIGLVAESWGELSVQEQDRLIAFLERLVVSKQSLQRWE